MGGSGVLRAFNCSPSIKQRSQITVSSPVAADHAALRRRVAPRPAIYGVSAERGKVGSHVQRSRKGWRPAHLVQRLDTLVCRFPETGVPTAARSAPAVRLRGSTGCSLRRIILTFLGGDGQHVRLDAVKCDKAALGLQFPRIREVPDVTTHLV